MFSEKSGVLIAPKDGVYLPVLDITPQVTDGDSDGSVVIDEWTYDLGTHSLVRYLTFEQGRLLRVATGGYGNKL